MKNLTRAAPDEVRAVDRTVQIVVPCFNEEKRFQSGAFADFLTASSDLGLILVNDGSTDATLQSLHNLAIAFPQQVTVVNCDENQGKAEAVRRGLNAAIRDSSRGPAFVGYWDADLATPLYVIKDFLRILERLPRVDIVVGARVALLGRDIDRKPSRHYLGRVFATGASVCLNLPVYDTQCGAKIIRVSERTATCWREPFMSRWIFDVELLARYLASGGTRAGLYEEPVPVWHDVAGSKVRAVDFLRGTREIIAVYRRYDLQQPLRWLIVRISHLFNLYTLAGFCGTLVHYVLLFGAVELANIHPVAATAAGATCGSITNYLLNYYFTFDSYAGHRKTIPRFLTVAIFGIGISSLGLHWAARAGVSYGWAQIACTCLVLLTGFTLNRFWTFAGPGDSDRPVAQ